MKIWNWALISVLFITNSALAAPPTPKQSSQEEIGVILKAIPGQMCTVTGLQLLQSTETQYSVQLRSYKSACLLTYKVWREALTTLPDGRPAPSDAYIVKTAIQDGDITACNCQ